ncbi:hypothetical protein [Azorhizobium caulinodans]|uniref:Uncharacterized protein n=1 Tax=Azorhizobium caulinodans (strain ATCC 43989 / DSM 5975 / JCM 20966 / LMG 6465 / NBRC 14845 / NCIMB 13405 / ORS 571) TaxID=438753 RepID=A8HQW6_AZOC5|nr:hypothetical protein [Azorhizobium caulinodans]BAF87068.1 hypothetical protein AZC_1070 [Azorhizobium caulinodans ORS 571]
MFLDVPSQWPPQDPPPEPPKARFSPKEEKFLLWVVALNVLGLFIAPVGGFTILNAVRALFGP